MHSILVDLYKIKNRHSGLGEFSYRFHQYLQQQATEDLEFTFLTPRKDGVKPQPGFKYRHVSLQKRYVPSWSATYDLWHSLQQFPSHKPNGKTPWLLTVHDLNFLSEKNQSKAQGYLKQLQKNVNRAQYLSTISHYTAEQMAKHLDLKGKKPVIIPNGVYLEEYPDTGVPPYVSGSPYFFSIGIFSAKKNFKVLLPLLNYFPDHKLVLAGNHETSYGREIVAAIRDWKLEERVILPGRVDNREKYALYKNCRAFLFPSLAEGFGLPVIEAMMAGAPVFLSTEASLPEVGGKLAYYWPELTPEAMAGVLEKNLAEFESNTLQHRKNLQQYAARFSWSSCINDYCTLYRNILKQEA